MRDWAFSTGDADRILFELAQARKLLIVEVADLIVAGDWAETGASQEMLAADAGKWLGSGDAVIQWETGSDKG